jgi:hypothetical protein
VPGHVHVDVAALQLIDHLFEPLRPRLVPFRPRDPAETNVDAAKTGCDSTFTMLALPINADLVRS